DERLPRAVFDALAEGIIVWTSECRIVDANRSAADLLGIAARDLEGLTLHELARKLGESDALRELDGRPCASSHYPLAEVRRTGEAVRGRVIGITRDGGQVTWLEIDVQPVDDDEHGQLIVSSFRDITSRKAGEDRMRALSAIVESSGDAILRESLDGYI